MSWRERKARRTIWRYWNRRMTLIGRRLRETTTSDEELVG